MKKVKQVICILNQILKLKNNISTIRNNNVTDCVDDDYDMGF